MKPCSKCLVVKPIESFNRDKTHADGLASVCRECRILAKKQAWVSRSSLLTPEQIAEDNKKRGEATKRWIKKNPQIAAKYKKLYRSRHPEAKIRHFYAHKAKNPEKVKARAIAMAAIRSGKIVRLPCEVCGNPKSESHHDDYSKPLDVRFLCLKHHREFHKLHPHPHLDGTT